MHAATDDVAQETPVTAAPSADAQAPGEAEPERDTGPPPTDPERPTTPTTATTATTAVGDAPAGDAGTEASGLAVPAVLVLLVVAALTGAAIAAVVLRARSRTSGAGAARAAADVGSASSGTATEAGGVAPCGVPADGRPPRTVEPLAHAAIDVRDRVGNAALADRLAAGLAATGWTTVDPTGDRFDPARHVAVDREPTGDAGLGGVIAAVERVGYLGPDGDLVRPPEVVVYAYAGGGAPA